MLISFLSAIENFIVYFFRNCPTNCPACREPLDAPAKLPCTHVLCAICARQNETCPTDNCDQKIPSGFDYKPEEDADIEYVFTILNIPSLSDLLRRRWLRWL